MFSNVGESFDSIHVPLMILTPHFQVLLSLPPQ